MANKAPYGSPLPPKEDSVAAMYADNQLKMAKTVKDLHAKVKEMEKSGDCTPEQYNLANTYLYNLRLVMIFLGIVGGVLAFVGTIFLASGSWFIAIIFYVPAIMAIWKSIKIGLMKDDLPGDYELVE